MEKFNAAIAGEIKFDYEHTKARFQKFAASPFRPYQEEAISFIHGSRSQIPVVWAPTGAGKSLIGTCAGAAVGAETGFTYLVASKALQDQLARDFPEMAVLKGRSNYPCKAFPNRTCDDCFHSKRTPCRYKRECHYEVEKAHVLAQPYRLLNYHYFLAETNNVGLFSNRSPIVICDEGDVVEHLLSEHVSLYVSGKVQKRLNINPPKYLTTQSGKHLDDWKRWAGLVISRTTQRIREIDGVLETEAVDAKDEQSIVNLTKERKAMANALDRAKMFREHVDDTWILEKRKTRYSHQPAFVFKPTWLTEELSERFFFRHGQKFVFMSATFPPVEIMGKLLGRNSEAFDYYEVPSQFPVENRPVYLDGVANLTKKTFDGEVGEVVKAVDRILAKHGEEKGIIHTVSYKLRDKIREGVNGVNGERLMFHEAADRSEVLERFKRSSYPYVLVSPSMERGVDLPGDCARFTIICKAPYESLGDKLVNKRVYGGGNIGGLWYKSMAAQNLIQMCGRAVRSMDDHAVTYVLDQQAVDLIVNYQTRLFPKYFLEAVEV